MYACMAFENKFCVDVEKNQISLKIKSLECGGCRRRNDAFRCVGKFTWFFNSSPILFDNQYENSKLYFHSYF